MATGRGTSKAGAKAKAKSKAKAVKTAAKPKTKKAAAKSKPSATRPKARAATRAAPPATPIAVEPQVPAVPETAPLAAEAAAVAAAPTEVPDPGPKIKTLSRAVIQWLKQNTFEAVIFVILGAAVGFLINAIMMIIRYEGFGVPPGAPATGSGNLISGSLFWIVFTTLVFAVIGYRRALGKEQFWKEVREFPGNVRDLFTKDRERAVVHLLWGFAGCMIVTTIISPSLGAVLALLILVSLPSMLGDIITELLQRAWDTITKAVSPTKNVAMVSSVAMAVGVVGVCFALAFAFLFEMLWGAATGPGPSFTPPGNFGRLVKLLAAVAAGGAAYAIGRQFARPTAAAALVFLAVMVGTLAGLGGSPARADDGGWLECGGTLSSYIQTCLNTTGGAVALAGYSIRGSIAAALGAALGAGLGGALGSMAQPSPPQAPPSEPTPPETEGRRARIRRRRREEASSGPTDAATGRAERTAESQTTGTSTTEGVETATPAETGRARRGAESRTEGTSTTEGVETATPAETGRARRPAESQTTGASTTEGVETATSADSPQATGRAERGAESRTEGTSTTEGVETATSADSPQGSEGASGNPPR